MINKRSGKCLIFEIKGNKLKCIREEVKSRKECLEEYLDETSRK
jgi:hypothetical protein